MTILYVGIAGIFGALARYGLSLLWNPVSTSSFPWGTLFCNVAGCFSIAYLAFGKHLRLPSQLRTALMTGFIGSFTTFSTFSFETVDMLRHGHFLLAAFYVGGSFCGGLGFTWLGIRCGERNREGGSPS